MPKGDFNAKPCLDDYDDDDDEEYFEEGQHREDGRPGRARAVPRTAPRESAAGGLETAEKTVTVRHSIASIPHIIGKQGTRINDMMRRWNCVIDVGAHDRNASPTTTVTTTIRGILLDSLSRAKGEIQSIDAQVTAEAHINPQGPSFEAVVSNISPGLAIGRGGENIRRARTMLVHVDVVDGANEVHIRGASQAHVDAAVRFFQDLVANNFERPVPDEAEGAVLRDFSGPCTTMYGVLIQRRGGASYLVGPRDKVMAAEQYLRARARDGEGGGRDSSANAGRRGGGGGSRRGRGR